MMRCLPVVVTALLFLSVSSGAEIKDAKLPFTGLPPAKLAPDLCVLKYPVRTTSPECQAFFDQGLGFFYSYVWMEAARSFETATRHDPDCAMAWWGLSRAYEKWKPGSKHQEALKKSKELLDRAASNEKYLIRSRLCEFDLEPPPTGAPKLDKADLQQWAAAKHLDELMSIHDDEEAYFLRAQLASKSKLGRNASTPYYKALVRINPLHPGANHELVHFYESFQRPGLGWVHAENYIKSSPGIPHAWHMQAHLATRLGRWDKSVDWSARAIEVETAYHKLMGLTAKDDYQYTHHLEILTVSLIHDGRFKEARAIEDLARKAGYKHEMPWFRLRLAAHDWDGAIKIAEDNKKSNKARAAYMAALVYLSKGDTERALPEIEVLRQAFAAKKQDKTLESYMAEVHGWLLVRSGAVDDGLKMLLDAVNKTKASYSHHSWGNGSYFMEAWGVAALEANRLDVAEEAFLEALAHDRGSVRGALGMQLVCERQNRNEEAAQFADLARRSWKKADPKDLEATLALLRNNSTAKVSQAE